MRAFIFGIWLLLLGILARSSEKKSYGNSVCSKEFTCGDFCQSSEGSKYQKKSKRCNRNAEKTEKKCTRRCKTPDCRQICRNGPLSMNVAKNLKFIWPKKRKTFQEEIVKCPCFDHTNESLLSLTTTS